MIHSDPAQSYPASSYDDYLCLKPPHLLWVAVLYLSRALTLPIIMAVGHFSGVDASAIAAFRSWWSPESLGPSMIAAIVLYAMFRRVPGAPVGVRWIWARGRIVLSVAAMSDCAVLTVGLMRRGEIDDASLLTCAAAMMDLFFLLYIVAARRVRLTFAEFPEPLGVA